MTDAAERSIGDQASGLPEEGIRLPTRDEAARAAIVDLCTHWPNRVRRSLRSVPAKEVRAIWGGGIRVEKLSERALSDGLLRAARDEHWLKHVLNPVWGDCHGPFINAVLSCVIRWLDPGTHVIAPAAWEWLALRFEPTLNELAFALRRVNQRLGPPGGWNTLSLPKQLVSRTSKGQQVLTPPPWSPRTLELVADPSELAMELLSLPHDQPAIDIIRGGRLQDLGLLLETSGNDKGYSAHLAYLSGNADRALELLDEEQLRPSDELDFARSVALRALIFFQRDDPQGCLDVLMRLREVRDTNLLHWPTWYTLRGLAYLAVGRWRDGALAFLEDGGGSREHALLPIRLATEALRQGGVSPGPLCLSTIANTSCSHAERVACFKEVRSLVAQQSLSSTERPAASIGDEHADDRSPEVNEEVRPDTALDSVSSPPAPTPDSATEQLTKDDVASRPESDASEAPSPPWKVRSHALQLLEETLETHAAVKERYKAAVDGDKLDALEALRQELLQTKDRVAAAVLSVQKELGSDATQLPEFVTAAEGRLKWLQKADELYGLRDLRTREKLDRQRTALAAQCRELGIDVPDALYSASTEEDVAAVQLALAPTLRLETAYVSLRNGADLRSNAELQSLAVAQRVDLYKRLGSPDTIPPCRPDTLLAAWLHDDKTWLQDDSVRSEATRILRQMVDSQSSLPQQAWAFWRSIWGPNSGPALDTLGPAALASTIERDHVTARDFFSAFDGISDLPAPLALLRALHAARHLPDSERVAKTSALLRRFPDSNTAKQALLDALLAAHRWGEALLLASIGSRQGWLTSTTYEHRDALFACILRTPPGLLDEPVFAEVLTEPVTFLENALDVVLLFSCAARHNLETLHFEVLYGSAGLVKQASDLWPATMHFLGAAITNLPACRAEMLTVSRAMEAHSSFRHDLQRVSAYSGWRFGKDYQRGFNEILNAAFSDIAAGRPAPQRDPDDIIALISDTHRLPTVEGGGKAAMQSYLVDQLNRLNSLAAATEMFSSWQAYEHAASRRLALPTERDRITSAFGSRAVSTLLRDEFNRLLRYCSEDPSLA